MASVLKSGSLMTIIISIASLSSANPLPTDAGHTWVERAIIPGFPGCDDIQKAKLMQDFADAANMALHAYSMDKASTAWTHYFRDQGDDQVTSMWDMIQLNNDPNGPYRFSVRCAAQDDAECTSSFGITDAAPDNGNREMKICAKYFTHPWTINSLNSKELIKNPSRRDNSWCKTGNNFRWFSVGGLTLMHEMTHLDSLSAHAGYPAVVDTEGGFTAHGTQDIDGWGDDDAVKARRLKTLWDKGQNVPGTLEPYRHAESVAASALEWYFIKFCDFQDITM